MVVALSVVFGGSIAAGIHESGFLHDVPRCVWGQGVCNAWGTRVAARRAHVGTDGWRRALLLSVLNLATYHYAEVSERHFVRIYIL